MLRSATSKVMWVGRATVFLVGLAVILALLFGAASTALAANGKPFLLGKKNVAKAVSTLVKQGPGPALSLMVKAGQPPLKVNSSGKVANLNADKLDGKDSTGFYAAGSKVADSAHADQADNATNAGNADTLDGKNSNDFILAAGDLPRGTTLRGNFEIDADADGFASVASNAISFGFALSSPPVVHTIDVNEAPPQDCPGTASFPEAAPGHLCIYESFEQNERDAGGNFYPNSLNTTRYGTGIYTQSATAGFFVARGTWAVTAP